MTVIRNCLAICCVLVAALITAPVGHSQFNGCGPGLCQGSAVFPLSGASIDLDFANNRTFGCNTFLDCLSIVRATPATSYAQTSSGTLTGFAANTLRMTDLGLLIEEARTNLQLWSSDFSNAAWIKESFSSGTNPVVTTASGNAPDGTNTANKVVFSRTNGTSNSDVAQAVTLGATATYIGSLYVQAFAAGDVGKVISIWQYDGTVKNLQNVTLTAAWQRVQTTGASTLNSGSSRQLSSFGLVNGDGASTGTVNVLCWQADGQQGSFITSPVPTTTASVTRAADVVKMTGLNFPPPFSLFAKVTPVGQAQTIDILNTQTSLVNSVGIYTPSAFNAWVRESSSTTANVGVGSGLAANTVARIAARYAINDVNVAGNGSAGTPDASVTPPTMTQLNFGPSPVAFAGTYLNGYYSRVALFRSGLTDAALAGLNP